MAYNSVSWATQTELVTEEGQPLYTEMCIVRPRGEDMGMAIDGLLTSGGAMGIGPLPNRRNY